MQARGRRLKAVALIVALGVGAAWAGCESPRGSEGLDGGPGGGPDSGPDGGPGDGPDDVVRSAAARNTSPEVTGEEAETLAADNRAFAVDLYHELRALEALDGGNLFCSPYSISLALAMAYAGAREGTAAEMAEALHYTLEPEALHRAFNWLDLELASRAESAPADADQPFTLNLVNSAWAQLGYPFETDYLDLLAESYGAGIHVADFQSEPEAARQAINAWTAEETADRITELLPPEAITDYTKLVLVNAIYFAAGWGSAFNESATYDEVFSTLGGEVSVPMMHQRAGFRLVDGASYQALQMPYEGGQLGMVVILPDEGAFEAVEASLDAEMLDGLLREIDSAGSTLVDLAVPRFTFRSPFSLKEVLEDLGMPIAFVRDEADFTGIAPRPMWISAVLHEAFVSVDEFGTEAAAATAVIIDGDGDAEPDYRTFRADRPFLFLIRDIPTNSILFLGRVTDPS